VEVCEIVVTARGLGRWIERTLSAESAEDALDSFLDSMETAGVVRTGATTATWFGGVTIEARIARRLEAVA
jgi:hypothetical protein